jgi:hypothetical protein
MALPARFSSPLYDVYIDESSQTKCHYCVIGALAILPEYVPLLVADIIEARGHKFPITYQTGGPRSIKWEKAKGHDHLIGYSKVMDAFFRFSQKHKPPIGFEPKVHCIAVDMTKRDDKQYNFGDADLGFCKDVNSLCVSVIGRRYKTARFHLYPDRRTTKQSLTTALNIMNNTSALFEDESRFLPFEKMDWAETEDFQQLQLVDIVIGAIAFKLNGWRDVAKPNKTKAALCDMIVKRTKIPSVFKNTPPYVRLVTIFHRNFSGHKKR